VVEASRRTESLLEGLLLLARSQRGLVRREPVDLAATARDAVDREPEADGLSIRLDLQAAEVLGDPALVARLVANLVENAVRYNRPDGWVRVRLSRSGDRAELVVENSGPVVEREAAERLAEPFQRLARGTDRGAGLGLSIVRAVAEAHGGELRIAPRAEGGLRVEVALPLRAAGDPAAPAPRAARPTGSRA
jgi:signal transduction histidine kinase